MKNWLHVPTLCVFTAPPGAAAPKTGNIIMITLLRTISETNDDEDDDSDNNDNDERDNNDSDKKDDKENCVMVPSAC